MNWTNYALFFERYILPTSIVGSKKELPSNPAYRVNPYQNAVLKEIIFDAYVFRQTWTVIHLIDIYDLVNEGLYIDEKILTLEKYCLKLKYGISQKFPQNNAIKLLKKKYQNVQKSWKNLFIIINIKVFLLWLSLRHFYDWNLTRVCCWY